MKLVRYGKPRKEKPGLIDSEGRLRDLSAVVNDIGPDQLGDAALARLHKLKSDRLPLVKGSPRMGCPVASIGKFIAIGLNYADHAAEAGMPIPAEPIVFMKATSCIQGRGRPHHATQGLEKIGLGGRAGGGHRRSRHGMCRKRMPCRHVAGYCVVNDVSERAFQIERGGTWDKGKGCDTFGPIGPWLVTRDEIANPQRLDLWLDLNGRRDAKLATRAP
jgi:2,4-diketo-3-deoxy-L-fuconate hydrolase